MNKFNGLPVNADSVMQNAENFMKRHRLAVPLAIFGLELIHCSSPMNSYPVQSMKESKIQFRLA